MPEETKNYVSVNIPQYLILIKLNELINYSARRNPGGGGMNSSTILPAEILVKEG
ncbi:MAG: hypothetical protein HKO89_05455 [Saprospiraceae bacterium]|nr:hypothetical protein [Saprospiraceae bacterium]